MKIRRLRQPDQLQDRPGNRPWHRDVHRLDLGRWRRDAHVDRPVLGGCRLQLRPGLLHPVQPGHQLGGREGLTRLRGPAGHAHVYGHKLQRHSALVVRMLLARGRRYGRPKSERALAFLQAPRVSQLTFCCPFFIG
jgi:hypothetical protein